MNSPEVTVLTPVYNGETHIKECIESVIAQTYKNWKLFIINNCSTDRTLEILNSYAKLDSRIKVFSNETLLSAVENHNAALRLLPATSAYCKVLQGDDWLFPQCLEEMVGIGERYPQVGLIGAYRLDSNEVKLDALPYPSHRVAGRDICRSDLLGHYNILGSPTSTMIRSNHVRSRDPFYDNSHVHWDKVVCFDILKDSDFGFVHQVLTFTRRREEDSTSKAVRLNSYLTVNIFLLKKYGPTFLSSIEQASREKLLLNRYYQYLGSQMIRFREREFWEFHKAQQNQIGINVSWTRIGLHGLLSSVRTLLKTLVRNWI